MKKIETYFCSIVWYAINRPRAPYSAKQDKMTAAFEDIPSWHPDYCADCDDYLQVCGTPCEEHPEYCAKKKAFNEVGPVQKSSDTLLERLNDALQSGESWGDIILDEEERNEMVKTPEQKEADLRIETQKEIKANDGLKKYVVDKSIRQHCHMVGDKNVLKHKYRKPCENLSEPAKKLPDGSFYEGGCWAHKVGACPFMHPGEEKIYIFNDHRPLKLINGQPPKQMDMSKVAWLTVKAKPQPSKQIAMQDAW